MLFKAERNISSPKRETQHSCVCVREQVNARLQRKCCQFETACVVSSIRYPLTLDDSKTAIIEFIIKLNEYFAGGRYFSCVP